MDWDGMEGTGRDWDELGWHWEELGWTGLNWERQPPHPLHESLPPPPPPLPPPSPSCTHYCVVPYPAGKAMAEQSTRRAGSP